MVRRKIVIAMVLMMSGWFLVSCDKDKPFIEKKPKEEEPIDTVLKCNEFSELCAKRLDEITTLMTHNSFNNSERNYVIPNQDYSVSRQLKDGVRGLMLDVYTTPNGPALYHGVAALGKEPLYSVMKEIKTFLTENPHEVISIIFENHCTHEEILQVMDSLELSEMIYLHKGVWPTIEEMIQANKRLVLMVENQNGYLLDGLLYAWQHTFDSEFDFKSVNEMDCSIKRGGAGQQTFYLLNHWVSNALGMPDKSKAKNANSWSVLGERVKRCSDEHQRKINFLGVDFYNIGEAIAIADSLNGVKR